MVALNALVKFAHRINISSAETRPVMWIFQNLSLDFGLHGNLSVLGESIWAIEHNGIKVKLNHQSVLVGIQFLELGPHVLVDVIPEDVQILVTIRSALFVVHAQSVAKFMDDSSMVVTSISKRELLSAADHSDHGEAALASVQVDIVPLVSPGCESDTVLGYLSDVVHGVHDLVANISQ